MRDLSWSELLARITKEPNSDDGQSAVWVEVRRRIAGLVLVVQRGLSSLTDEDAEDIVQQTIVQMGKRATLDAIRSASAPNAYLFKLVRNAAIDTVRRNSRLTPLEERAVSTVEQSDAAVDVRAAMEMLAPEERELLVLRFWEGMSLAQIATTKGLPYSTVAKRFFRLMSRLRMQMGKEE